MYEISQWRPHIKSPKSGNKLTFRITKPEFPSHSIESCVAKLDVSIRRMEAANLSEAACALLIEDPHDVLERSENGQFLRVSNRQFREELGRSEFKVVSRGLNLNTGCEVSWHAISLTMVDPGDVGRIVEEMNAIAHFEHANIIRWQALWLTKDQRSLVLVTDLMPEGSLRQYLRKIKVPRAHVVKQWTIQLLQALAYLHSRHPFPIVHNYLKPDSIYVLPNTGKIVISGLCKTIIFRNCPLHMRKSTFLAPEHFNGVPGPGVDVYSLGMTVLEVITNAEPYDECKSPSEAYRKMTAGHRPDGIERILDEDAKDFVRECLRPVEQRPTALSLLKHRFLQITKDTCSRPLPLRNRSQERLLLQQSLSSPDTHKGKKGRTVDIELLLPDSNRRSKKIGFTYDIDKDTPEAVALEMIQELHLSPDLLTFLITQIQVKGTRVPRTRLSEPPQRSPDLPSPSTLKFGDRNLEAEVMKAQTLLNQVLGGVLRVNGVFGRKTEACVKQFEEMQGWTPTGVLSARVWEALSRPS